MKKVGISFITVVSMVGLGLRTPPGGEKVGCFLFVLHGLNGKEYERGVVIAV